MVGFLIAQSQQLLLSLKTLPLIDEMCIRDRMEFYIVGSTEANSLQNKISNESPVGRALIGKVVGDCVEVETQAGDIQYKVLEIQRVS